jgi:hypothetical protein
MRRAHRFVHRLVWPVLTLAVLFGLVTALALRPPPEEPAPNEAAQERRP